MKTLFMVLFYFFIVSKSTGQTTNLIGTWNIIDFSVISENNNDTRDEQKLKEDDSVWDLFFMEEGKLKQTSNMSNGKIETWEGKWKISDKDLTLLLEVNNQEIELFYTYTLKENIFILEHSNPKGTMKIVSKFRTQ